MQKLEVVFVSFAMIFRDSLFGPLLDHFFHLSSPNLPCIRLFSSLKSIFFRFFFDFFCFRPFYRPFLSLSASGNAKKQVFRRWFFDDDFFAEMTGVFAKKKTSSKSNDSSSERIVVSVYRI